jgi:hypothetical protein
VTTFLDYTSYGNGALSIVRLRVIPGSLFDTLPAPVQQGPQPCVRVELHPA